MLWLIGKIKTIIIFIPEPYITWVINFCNYFCKIYNINLFNFEIKSLQAIQKLLIINFFSNRICLKLFFTFRNELIKVKMHTTKYEPGIWLCT